MLVTALDDIRERLTSARTIAVLGVHREPQKPAFYVPDYLHRVGYRIIPVNPVFAGETLFGEVVRPDLSGVVCDMVDIFRRADALMAHLDEIRALTPRPRTIWLQLGIVGRAFTDALVADGFDVVEDRCTLADHRLFGLPKVAP